MFEAGRSKPFFYDIFFAECKKEGGAAMAFAPWFTGAMVYGLTSSAGRGIL